MLWYSYSMCKARVFQKCNRTFKWKYGGCSPTLYFQSNQIISKYLLFDQNSEIKTQKCRSRHRPLSSALTNGKSCRTHICIWRNTLFFYKKFFIRNLYPSQNFFLIRDFSGFFQMFKKHFREISCIFDLQGGPKKKQANFKLPPFQKSCIFFL